MLLPERLKQAVIKFMSAAESTYHAPMRTLRALVVNCADTGSCLGPVFESSE